MKTLFKNARILKMDDSPLFIGDLLVSENRIIKIAEHIDEYADEVIDCNGNVIMPGFKNAHAHAGMTFLRSKADNMSLQEWLFNEIFPREDKLQPSDVYHCSKLAFLEYIKGGITASFEHYFFPLETAKSAQDIGFRVSLLGTYNNITSKADLLRLYKKFNSDKESLVTYNIGVHAEYTTTIDDVKLLSSVCRKLKAPFFTHLGETKKEVEECIEKRGISPLKFFLNERCFDYGGAIFHGIYLSDEDIEICKKNNISIVTNPGSNLKLGSGICPVEKYRENGLTVAIGTDGPSSNNSLDMFKEMSLVSYLSKIINANEKNLNGYEILKMATVEGARIMNLSDCDILAEGKKADIIMIDLDNPSMQPLNNIVENIVYSGSKDCVKLTMINGKILYKDGKFLINDNISEIYKNVQNVTERIDKELNK